MQQTCGFEYTSKLQKMFQDIGVSKDLNERFRTHQATKDPLDCKFVLSDLLCVLHLWVQSNSNLSIKNLIILNK